MTDEIEDEEEKVVTSWSSVLVTFVVSVAQFVLFYVFFLYQRGKEKQRQSWDLYEPRQHNLRHRSPPPYGRTAALLANDSNNDDDDDNNNNNTDPNFTEIPWYRAAWQVEQDETLRCVGLDAYMFLRFLRMGARLTLLGTTMAYVLIPVYATGEARGIETEQFNQLTLARVEAESDRLWAPLVSWYIFVAFLLHEFVQEWKLYASNRNAFMARGDPDLPKEYRYAVRVEEVPSKYRSEAKLYEYFSKLFPGKICKVVPYLNVDELQAMVDKRLQDCIAFEKAQATSKAKPDKPPPQVNATKGMCSCTGEKRDAMEYYQDKIQQANDSIDAYRRTHNLDSTTHNSKDTETGALQQVVPASSSGAGMEVPLAQPKSAGSTTEPNDQSPDIEVPVPQSQGVEDTKIPEDSEPQSNNDKDKNDDDGSGNVAVEVSSAAVVIFTSLRAKQAAIQCQLRENIDTMVTTAAPDPRGVIWKNATVPLSRQKVLSLQAMVLWTVGVLFWAVPIGFVASISNLASILETVGVDDVDPDTAWYGLVSGLLPVIALAIFMAVLYLAIVAVATYYIRCKSHAEVDAYALFWHQVFQFANLWLLIIGGSLFNQLDSILNDLSGLAETIAAAMPGASVFFCNLINVGSLGAFGLELSLLPTYGVTMLLNLLTPEAARTQRMLDDAKKTPVIDWGLQIPRMVFIFLVAIVYMPIVPIIEVFALIYFAGHYLVWKHQCLHVYAQEHEGGGDATWGQLFGFLMLCLYTGEVVFIAYMGIKEAPIQSALGFVPLACTVLLHLYLRRNVIAPLKQLSLEKAANVDIDDGELEAEMLEVSLYAQPCLQDEMEDRQPFPYRREDENSPSVDRMAI